MRATAGTTILDEILAHKLTELAKRQRVCPLEEVRAQAWQADPPRDFLAALRRSPARPALIAEVKRASPSRGTLDFTLDPARLARVYRQNGAAAISVLTDARFFHGSLADLQAVRGAVALPVLCKDFILDVYQLYEARAAGADAVLLIVSALEDEMLHRLYREARALGMAALVEVHDEAELRRALALRPRLIGVNNRDLRTFRVDLATTARLRPLVPPAVMLVAESGVHAPSDAIRLAQVGADAMLVGEALVTAPDPGAQVRALTRTLHVKICGVTTVEDALAAVEAGADLLGFNFYPQSRRYITPAICERIVAQLPDAVTRVGVFVNARPEEVIAILDDCSLDLAQLSGDEPPEALAALGGRAFKAIRPVSLAMAQAAVARYAVPTPPALLVDACRPGEYGGTGHTADWALARALAATHPILLAGGLRPENVAEAVRQVCPWGVDVASGVESRPGRKDAQRMAAFVAAGRGAGATVNSV